LPGHAGTVAGLGIGKPRGWGGTGTGLDGFQTAGRGQRAVPRPIGPARENGGPFNFRPFDWGERWGAQGRPQPAGVFFMAGGGQSVWPEKKAVTAAGATAGPKFEGKAHPAPPPPRAPGLLALKGGFSDVTRSGPAKRQLPPAPPGGGEPSTDSMGVGHVGGGFSGRIVPSRGRGDGGGAGPVNAQEKKKPGPGQGGHRGRGAGSRGPGAPPHNQRLVPGAAPCFG